MKILITGATGYLGQLLLPFLLDTYKPEAIRLFSRNDWKMAQLLRQYNDLYTYKTLRPLIGDVCDRERIMSVVDGCDLVIHTAAMKRVEIASYCPQECIKTNVIGSMNVMDACIQKHVTKVIFISSDKAVNAYNLYGRTKAVMESMVTCRAESLGLSNPIMVVVRYGNVIGSTGAVIPYFINLAKENKPLPITDKNMTRFLVTRRIAKETVKNAINNGKQKDIILPNELYSVNIENLTRIIIKELNSSSTINYIGQFPGEKLHEEISEGLTSDKYLCSDNKILELLKEEELI